MNDRMKLIIHSVCKFTGLSYDDLKKKTRKRDISEARMFCYYFARECTDLTLDKIGSYFNVSHCNVIHGKNKIKSLILFDKHIKNIFHLINKDINENISLSVKTYKDDVFKSVLNLLPCCDTYKQIQLIKYNKSI